MAKSDKKYRVGKSKIQGKGVFSKQDLKPGDYIGKAHTINKLYTDYDFTELGKNHNHSDNPNVQNVLIGNERHFVATKPIKKGEELTTDYTLQPDLEQPEDFEKAKGGKKLTSSKAKEILHDKSVHGQPLTDKQRKFFGAVASGYIKAETGGWLDAYDVPKAQNGMLAEMRRREEERLEKFPQSKPVVESTRPQVSAAKKQEQEKKIKYQQTVSKIQKETGVSRPVAEQILEVQTQPILRTTIGPDVRTDEERRLAALKVEDLNRYRKDVLGIDPNMSQAEMDRNRKRNERLLNALEVGTLLEAPVMLGARALTTFGTKALPAFGEYLTTQTPLRNAYKYNPFAFKPNPEAYYRMIGKEGFEDALEAGVLRRPLNSKYSVTSYSKGKPWDDRFPGEYMVEAKNSNHFVPDFPGEVSSKYDIPISSEDLSFYKKDWLRGYKEVNVPKFTFDEPFTTYLTPKEAAIARAERMLAQENKWKVNSPSYLKDKFINIADNFEEVLANEIGKSPSVLGTNAYGKAFSFKDAPLSEANRARIAAHETGHFYRNMADEANEWNSFFDFSKLKHKTKVYLRGKPTATGSSIIEPKVEGLNIQKQGVPHGDEIRERAAQLKDYIAQKNGIPLNEDFIITEAQLDDAIKNYTKDTGLDNSMSSMLSSLKDKKGFLNAMNKYALGIVPAGIIGGAALEQKEKGGVVKAQNGIEGTMGGLTDKGFNYNPAWGGAWQNGGKLQPPMAGAVQTVPMAQNGRSTAIQDFLKMSSARKEFEPSASVTPRVDMIGLPGNVLIAVPSASLDARPMENLSINAGVNAPIIFSKEGIGTGENLNYNIGAGYQLNRNNYIGARYGNNQGFGLDYRHTLFNKNKKKGFQTGGNIGTRPEDEDIREIYEWEKEYTNSPRFAYLSSKQGDSPEITQRRRDVINKFNIDKDIVRVPEGVSYVGDEGDGLKFYLSPDAGDWPSYSDINAHEIGHFPYNTGELNFPESTYNEIQARNKEFQKMKASGISNDDIEHDISPNEVRADKNQLLYQMKKLGIYDATKDGDITPEQLDKFKKSGQWNRLQRLYNDDDILWLMNNIAQNTSGVSDKAFMGASIPGSTGFTYARTQGAAPSEGPYAKKTLPSAENGMAYYQAGLDFKPKTISRDGSSVNKADEYPLEKLDNLLNFTNYNKPKAKSGGWLDKYN